MNIYNQKLQDLNVFNRGVINTLNAYTLYLNDSNSEYENALRASDIILPDGVSISVASRLINKIYVK